MSISADGAVAGDVFDRCLLLLLCCCPSPKRGTAPMTGEMATVMTAKVAWLQLLLLPPAVYSYCCCRSLLTQATPLSAVPSKSMMTKAEEWSWHWRSPLLPKALAKKLFYSIALASR